MKKHTFGEFRYEQRMVPNGIYAILTIEKTIFCGLSNGCIAMGSGGEFSLFKVHDKAIRSLLALPGKYILSTSNDGRVIRSDFSL